jgi:hypothetical protein
MADESTDRPILGAGGEFAMEGGRTQGFGEKFHPQSLAEARAALAPQVDAVRQEARQLPDRLRGDRVIVRATLLPNYLAASHHPEDLRRDADLIMVGTRAAKGTLRQRKRQQEDAQTKTLLLAATDRSLDRLHALLAMPSPPESLANDLRKFESLALPGTERVIRRRRGEDDGDPEDELVWEAVLHPAVDATGRLSERAAQLILAKWNALIASLEGDVHQRFVRQVGNLTFVPVRLQRRHLDAVTSFNPLRTIRPMPRLRRLPERRLRSIEPGVVAPTPPAGGPPAEHRVVTFDGGVDATHPLLAPFVTEGDLTTAPRDDMYVSHGTLVTSALLYGHIDFGRPPEPPPAHVDHFRVLPAPGDVDDDDEPYWVLDKIVQTLRRDPHKWRIASLSYGPDEALDEDRDIDRFTAEIDELVHDLDLTFAVAVGNEGRAAISTLGEDRVMAPADGINVIGIGSCDALHPPAPVRASYSCTGPGRPGLRVQPIGVSFGGSDGQAFIGAEIGGAYQARQGTSFATPSAARGLATLLEPLSHLSANLARGFAAHFAVAPNPHDLVSVGYGRLRDDYRSVLNCVDGTISVVVQDSIERGATKTYALPYPNAGVDGRVKARWTISFTSPTDPQDAVEYTRAGLEVVFRPSSVARTMQSPRSSGKQAVDVDLRTDGALIQKLANEGYELSNFPKTRSGKAIRSEQTLREEGKWETVVRYEDGMNASSLHQPEIWITYYERAEGQLVPSKMETSLDFTLVMTVSAGRTPDLYERVLADSRFAVLTPLAVPVTVRV